MSPPIRIALLLCVAVGSALAKSLYPHLQCRDPGVGHGNDQVGDRKFLILSGRGGGIGNYLVFYPTAYYFAALTGRDLVVLDNSLIAEMCRIVQCGFPLYSEMQEAYPALLEAGEQPNYRFLKVWDFRRHLWNEVLVGDRAAYADGYKFSSGWYAEHNYSAWCVQQLSGCRTGDVSCEDRHAFQQLVRGPFKRDTEAFFKYLSGVPANFKRAMLSLPHAMAPRLDAAVHLRCQFRHFEYLVGPQDSLWPQHQKEIQDFLQSDDFNAGEQLFKEIARRLTEEVQAIVARRQAHRQQQQQQRRRWRRLRLDIAAENATAAAAEAQSEHERFAGDARSDRVYVYLASDNDQVKEAFAAYLVNHANLTVMRVRTGQHIAHAKDLGWLRSESAGVFTLVADWYALSLANLVVAWRRDTAMLSTFAQSARMFSGNSRVADGSVFARDPFQLPDNGSAPAAEAADETRKHSRGLQLVTIRGRTQWHDF